MGCGRKSVFRNPHMQGTTMHTKALRTITAAAVTTRAFKRLLCKFFYKVVMYKLERPQINCFKEEEKSFEIKTGPKTGPLSIDRQTQVKH